MPRGAKPKTYAPALVERVRDLYEQGHTQVEVAGLVGTSQKVVWNLMRRHGIETRRPVKRDQRGHRNSTWRGANASYTALHARVYVARGTPRLCDECGQDDPAKRYEWANLTGRYHDLDDYRRMRVPCHRAYDKSRAGGDVECPRA